MAREGLMDDSGYQFDDNDNCVWEYSILPLSGCVNFNIECGRIELGTRVLPNYKYCPTCGKEIKFIKKTKRVGDY